MTFELSTNEPKNYTLKYAQKEPLTGRAGYGNIWLNFCEHNELIIGKFQTQKKLRKHWGD